MQHQSDLPATKHRRALTSLNLKKGKGTAPNNPKKKGREAYLAAKKKLEAQRMTSSEDGESDQQPRPAEDETWTMEEAWDDHTQAIARVMTEAAPDFAKTPAVVEVALGAPEKWWNDVVVPRLARIAAAAYDGLEVAHGDVRVLDVGTGTGTMLPHLTAGMPAGVEGKVVALDVCDAMLDIVEERYPDTPMLNADFSGVTPRDLHPVFSPDAVVEDGKEATDAEMAATGDGKVDVVIMNAVYSLMLDEVEALGVAGRMLRRGGRLVVRCPEP